MDLVNNGVHLKNDEKGAPPVNTKLTLEFQETQFITKKEITEGY
jgi:hypothetical protein